MEKSLKNSMSNLLKRIRFKNYPLLYLTLLSILIATAIHWLGVLDPLELNIYDWYIRSLRGPLTGLSTRDSTYQVNGTDVVLVEIDDEAWRLIPESWPYSRGRVWSKVVENLQKAGAHSIVFDLHFDSPDQEANTLRNLIDKEQMSFSLNSYVSGDVRLSNAIKDAQENGCNVILASKIIHETTMNPPEYLSLPYSELMVYTPETGLVNDYQDKDGFLRRYAIGSIMAHEPDKMYLSLALKTIKSYYNIGDSVVPEYRDNTWYYGPLVIPASGQTFYLNYYGPPSSHQYASLPSWKTFPHYSLSKILDTRDYRLSDPLADIDWMEQYISDEIPEWIFAIEDEDDRTQVMESLGIGNKDKHDSPFENKVVIIGVTVETLHDYKATPFYDFRNESTYMPGMEVHATAIQNLIDQNFISVLGDTATQVNFYGFPLSHFVIILLLAVLVLLISTFTKQHPYLTPVLTVLLILLYISISFSFFMDDPLFTLKQLYSFLPFIPENGHLLPSLPLSGCSFYLPVAIPITTIFITYLTHLAYTLVQEYSNRKFLYSSFSSYISPELINIMFDSGEKPELGGQEGVYTAFFSDIASFSTLSEGITSVELTTIMNEYLSSMTDVLLENKGTLDKYIGDAIVAFWGAPVAVENQELFACKTALAMEKNLIALRQKWKSDGYNSLIYTMKHRVGLHTGTFVVGNMGSNVRMNYTMIGDSVNVCARLESSAKQYGISIQISEDVYEKVKEEYFCRFIDNVIVKGRAKPIKTYELLSLKEEFDPELHECITLYHNGIEAYQSRQWHKAVEAFTHSAEHERWRDNNPSLVYLERCNHFIDTPPAKEWDGVWTLTQK